MKNSKLVYLINAGEPLPSEGNREHRMCKWKSQLECEGFRVIFFTTDFEHQRKKWVQEFPDGYFMLKSYIPYKKNISFRRLLNHFFLGLSLFKALQGQSQKPDVIIVSYPTILLAFASILFGKIRRVKVIVDVRDKWPDVFLIHPIFILFIWPLFMIKKIIFSKADHLIAISPHYYKWASPYRIIQMCNVLPLAQPNVKKVKRYLSASEPIHLIFSGTLGSTYDLNMIISIHDILIEKKINFVIDVCGDGPKKKWLEDQIIFKKNIKLHGWLNKSDLQVKLDNAQFGLMFYNENAPQGWPNKLVEYMANGLPIINTLSGESWDLIEQEDLGINCKSSDLNIVVNWFLELIACKSKYSGLVQRNYSLHKNSFNDEVIFKQLLTIL